MPKLDSKCSFQGCDRPWYCKGLCVRHYEQRNEGKPLIPIRSQRKRPGGM
jgi:hypothetical protein